MTRVEELAIREAQVSKIDDSVYDGSHSTYQQLCDALRRYEQGACEKSELRLAATAHIEELRMEANALSEAIRKHLA